MTKDDKDSQRSDTRLTIYFERKYDYLRARIEEQAAIEDRSVSNWICRACHSLLFAGQKPPEDERGTDGGLTGQRHLGGASNGQNGAAGEETGEDGKK